MASGVQTQVKGVPAPAVAGDFADSNESEFARPLRARRLG